MKKNEGTLKMQIRMFGDACENLGQYLHLPLKEPKRIKAVQRIDRLWEEIEHQLKDIEEHRE